MNQYIYKVDSIKKIVDGDTIYFITNLGFYVSALVKGRLADVDAPEIYSGTAEEKVFGRLITEKVKMYVNHIFNTYGMYIKTKKTHR